MDTTDLRAQIQSDYLIDAECGLVQPHYAVIFTPRRQRNRFPENCVVIHPDREAALAAADPAANRHAGRVYGPSRSSEGFRLYYLVEWLD
jgi:hypothetical protein